MLTHSSLFNVNLEWHRRYLSLNATRPQITIHHDRVRWLIKAFPFSPTASWIYVLHLLRYVTCKTYPWPELSRSSHCALQKLVVTQIIVCRGSYSGNMHKRMSQSTQPIQILCFNRFMWPKILRLTLELHPRCEGRKILVTYLNFQSEAQ